MLCSYNIVIAGESPRLSYRMPPEGVGTVTRIDFNKYQVLDGMYSNSDLKKFIIITQNCNLQGTFKAATGQARLKYSHDIEGKALCKVSYSCAVDNYCIWYPHECCLINKVITK